MNSEEAKHFSEILKAYSEGKSIQKRTFTPGEGCTDWVDTDYISFYDATIEYRIKPEPTYRVYINAEEFLKAQKEHGPYIKGRLAVLTGEYHLPQNVHDCGVAWTNWADAHSSYRDLFDGFTWQDGTPCGIMED